MGAKTLKFKVRNYSNFTITSPQHTWRCAGNFFKVLMKFKMASADQHNFFCWRKSKKNGQKLFTFYNHITHDMDMCGVFLRFCWNQKWPPWINFNFFFVSAKTKSQKLFKFLQSHFSRYEDVQVILKMFYWNKKWPPWMNLGWSWFFVGTKNQKLKSEIINFCKHIWLQASC